MSLPMVNKSALQSAGSRAPVTSPVQPVHRVLAAVHDLPEECKHVLLVAARIARATDTPLTVMSVIETTPQLFPIVDGSTNIIADVQAPPSSTVLAGVKEDLTHTILAAVPEYAPGGTPHRVFNTMVLAGDPEYEIANQVAASYAAVLVIGRGEVRGPGHVLDALLNGIRSARVCRASHVPVIAVARPVNSNDPLQTIVIATDFSPTSWEAAIAAVRAAPSNAQIYVVHVLQDGSAAEPGRCEAARAGVTSWSAPLVALLPTGATLAVTVLSGDPYTALAAYLPRVNATCVAVGGHRPRYNTVTVSGRTVPERLLATWRGSIIFGPYHDVTDTHS
jgi:nucleotide-binding universal stress UspA family protein